MTVQDIRNTETQELLNKVEEYKKRVIWIKIPSRQLVNWKILLVLEQ